MSSPVVYALARPFGPRSIVGIVRLTLAPDALVVALLRAGGASRGFLPAALGEGGELRVPYAAIRSVFRRRGALHVVLDPRLSHTRLALARFASEPEGLVGLRWLRGFDERSLLRSVEATLVARLGLMPLGFLDEGPGDPVAPEVRLSPRSGRVAWVIALAAVATLGSIAALGPLREPVVVPPRFVEARVGVAAAVAEVPTDGLIVLPPPPPSCTCERAASPLWDRGIPAVSFLIQPPEQVLPEGLSKEPQLGGFAVSSRVAEEGGPPRFDLEVAAVNNSARSERDLRVVLTFARRDGQGRRVGVRDEGLFWEGALGAGRAVKWNAGGEGTEVRIDVDARGFLPGAPLDVARGAKIRSPAAADAFYELTRARLPVVRYHGATLLAYLGDPRALDAASALEARGEAERLWRERILRAAAPQGVCAVESHGALLRACVRNLGRSPVELVGLREPEGATRTFPLAPLTLEPARGVRVEVPLGDGPLPAELAPVLAP